MLLGDKDGKPALLVEKLIRAPEWSALMHVELTLAQNLEILVKVSQAASYAHRKCGLVHRDIKPQNVLVSEFGEVYLVDWGLAVQVGDEPKLDEAVRQLKEEPAGYILGPPAYMAPEMALGSNKHSAPATDVFLLGAILYEILSGHTPYNAYPRTAVLRAAAHWFRDVPEDVPEDLKAITLRAMAKAPADRYRDAGEFADAVQRYQSHVVADEQTSEAERQFLALQNQLKGTTALTSEPLSLLGSLIAATDRYRLAGMRWSDSKAGIKASKAGATVEPDEFTARGLERSLSGERSAREELVTFAMRSGDLALAESQVAELKRLNSERTDVLQTIVESAKKKRRRERLQRLSAVVATFMLLATSAYFLYQKTREKTRRELADQRDHGKCLKLLTQVESQIKTRNYHSADKLLNSLPFPEAEKPLLEVRKRAKELSAISDFAKVTERLRFRYRTLTPERTAEDGVREYKTCLDSYCNEVFGCALSSLQHSQLTDTLSRSPRSEEFVNALDEWLRLETDAATQNRLKALLKSLDPNEFRGIVRKSEGLIGWELGHVSPGFTISYTRTELDSIATRNHNVGEIAPILTAACQRHPDSFELHLEAGLHFYDNMESFSVPERENAVSAAKHFLSVAYSLQPDSVDSALSLARAERRLNDNVPRAEELIRRAIKIAPQQPEPFLQLAQLLFEQQ